MMNTRFSRYGRYVLAILLVGLLAGCTSGTVHSPLWLLDPNGPLARSSIFYLVVDVLLLSIVIVPATILTIWTFFRYRRGGKGGYDPTFNHSLTIEVVVWGVPLLIVVALSYYTYQGAMDVGPFNPRAVTRAVEASGNKQQPLHVDVISTDWQWLFVYPDQGIAMSNRLILPTGRKIEMNLTSTAVTNDFYVLKVFNQIYMMPGMRTKHNVYLDRPGTYQGFSTEFSGPGFSWMTYKMLSVTPKNFQKWVQRARNSPDRMTWKHFEKFAEPTINTGNVWNLYGQVDPDLFKTTVKSVRSGAYQTQWQAHLSEDMTSQEFKEKYGTKKDTSEQPEGTTEN